MQVTVDVFSGRPNPTWYVPPARGRGVVQDLPLPAPVPNTAPKLGFRGITVIQTEPGELPGPAPVQTRLAMPGAGADELSVARALVGTADAALGDDVASAVHGQLDLLARGAATDVDGDGDVDADDGLAARRAEAGCRERLTPMAIPFWNTPTVQPHNNCYNYATNFVSGTLAQPGRRSGLVYAGFDCEQVLAAARRDGLQDRCGPDAGVVGLGVWPGFDFHWWRLHPGGFWAHKIGWWPAQTVDNSDRILGDGLTPATCDRGPYQHFCGYFFVPPWMWVV